MHERGALRSLLTADPASCNTAIALGEEWLGAEQRHPQMPASRRRASPWRPADRLSQGGRAPAARDVLKVTISSPTLAQGLNLSATAVIMHSLHRAGETIEISEFKNVIGRAGRAYVDVEGIVLFPMFDDIAKKRRNWEALITDLGAREMESGLVASGLGATDADARAASAATSISSSTMSSTTPRPGPSPRSPTKSQKTASAPLADWERHVATLDTAILSLIGENDIPDEGIEAALDDILQSSLWQRRLLRHGRSVQQVLKAGLSSRSRFIWTQSTAAQRRGYFLAGVGLTTGHALDAIASEANLLLIQANGAILEGDAEAAIAAITGLAERVFTFYPFIPDPLPANWRDILRAWLLGQPLAALGGISHRKCFSLSKAALSIGCLGQWRRSASAPRKWR